MGMKWGTIDFETTYNFKISADGFDLQAPEVRHEFMVIPGIDGIRDFNAELGARSIVVRGVIIGTSNSDMYTKLIGLENELLGTLSATTDANFIAPTRALKDLTIPSFGSKKFPNCRCIGWRILKYFGKRILCKELELEIRFLQTRPFTVAV